MGIRIPVWRRKLTAIFAVIALAIVALSTPRMHFGGVEQPRLRTLAIPHAVQAAKDPGKKAYIGISAVLAVSAAPLPGWRDAGQLPPGPAAGAETRPIDGNPARGPPELLFPA